MNVLLVNTSERTGGAAIAASRLMHALNRHGVNARMIVRQKRGFPFYWERMVIWLHNRLSRRMLWYVDIANAGTDITLLPAFREADVIHLHWVNQGFLSLEVIDRILHSGKRIVWTMHDQWPYTAICHHSRDCRRFQTRCHDCPQLCYPSKKDLSHKVFTRKLALMGNAHVTFVGCSQWIAGLAATSALLRGQRIVLLKQFRKIRLLQCILVGGLCHHRLHGDLLESQVRQMMPFIRWTAWKHADACTFLNTAIWYSSAPARCLTGEKEPTT